MTDIQQARDVLAKHRGSATPGNWRAWLRNDADTDLIMLTAGNPELLDAIDGMLEWWQPAADGAPVSVRRIAAAIIDADERMNT